MVWSQKAEIPGLVMSIVRLRHNSLAQGFYTASEAAKLVEFSSPQKVYAWLNGWPRRGAGPVLLREYEPINKMQELSFLDLIEIRFVRYLRDYKVKFHTLRVAAAEARKLLKTTHPFASERLFTTDGAKIYLLEIIEKGAKEADDTRALDLISKQYEFYEAIKASLIKGVIFDPKSHMVDRWYPRPERFPEILIDPRIAYGRPATPHGAPAEALYDAWIAEEEDYDAVANWYELPVREVRQAVNFQAAVFHASRT